MTEKIELRVGNPPKNKAENGPISASPEIFLFLKVRFINFFLIPVALMYHILLCKMYKNSLKLRNIADLQALTQGCVKKITP